MEYFGRNFIPNPSNNYLKILQIVEYSFEKMLPILPNVLVNFVLKYFSRLRRRANDGVRPVGVSELPWRLPAQQGVHLEDHGASRVPSRTQVPVVWGIINSSIRCWRRSSKIIASSGNRTRAARVAGEHSTTEPTMLWYQYEIAIQIKFQALAVFSFTWLEC